MLILCGNNILLEDSDKIDYPTCSKLKKMLGTVFESDRLVYAFSIDDIKYFLYTDGKAAFECMTGADGAMCDGIISQDLKNLRESKKGPKHKLFAAYTGRHLSDWYRDTRFCGRCGKPMIHSRTERAMCCSDPGCRNTVYPRIMPAVIVGVINGDRLLITRYQRGYNHNALIAGFVEIGETVEETVHREVMEEAGIRVKNLRYYKTQPWGIANDILVGYFCEVDGDDTIRRDDGELKSALWLKADEIELQPDESSLTNEMMKLFKDSEIETYYKNL